MINNIHNPNCDGASCVTTRGEVRKLPHTANPDHGNSILCNACFTHELRYRVERNKQLAADARYALPDWDELKVYGD
jgi:hypothetical protein